VTRPVRICQLVGCDRDLTRRRSNVRYRRDAHRLAAYKDRRRSGAEPAAVRPPERFPFSPRVVAPESVLAGLLSWLEELPDFVGDHDDPESVLEALLDLATALEGITDLYLAASYGDEVGGGAS